ncbi:MAG: glycoside hydrolase N-terminal domain-containing protein, partial [Muribaculum intestinale]|nr:glycoside hydrolase N-terminal domain-containing protein [Muribaculum intestinale]
PPTKSLTTVKVNFASGDGASSATPFGVVYSTDGGNNWTVLDDYTAASHWNKYNDATYSLDADNRDSLIIRMLIQSATKTSNYNLKYVNILADDFQGPELVSIIPADGDTDVVTSGKVTMLFNESIVLKDNASATLTNNTTGTAQSIAPAISNTKASFPFEELDLSTSYTFIMPANSFTDLAGNICDKEYRTTFTTAAERPAAPPVLDSRNRLWYNRPAGYWEEALPLGNGRLGAMVSGSVAVDTIQLNEDTFWGQSPNTNHNPKAASVLKQVQNLIFSKDYVSAQRLAIPNWMSEGSHGAQYQAAGCVLVGFPGHRFNDEEGGATASSKDVQAYVRDLDMSRAVATTSYVADGVTYTREVFSSFDDNVTIMRLTASEPGRLNFNVSYAAPIKTNMEKLGVNTITADGMIKASLVPAKSQSENVDNKLTCFTFIKVINDGGTQTASSRRNIIQQGIVAGNQAAPELTVSDAKS